MNQAPSARVAAVIGGTGFLGRQIVRRLARDGYRVKVTSRYPNLAFSMKPLGDVGQIAIVRADIRNEAEIAAAVKGASVVVNLVGLLKPSGGASFEAVHAQGAGLVARACTAAGVSRLIHVSAIGADAESPSAYASTKAEGEAAAKQEFPGVTILRPSIVFGQGDGFFNMFANLMRMSKVVFPLFAGATKFQPVFVGDVADAVGNAVMDPKSRGRTYELGGPSVYTMEALVRYIAATTGRSRVLLPIPAWMLELGAMLTGWLPFAPITLDQARLLRKDNIVKAGPDSASVGTLADLCVQPTPVEAVVPGYLYSFRPTGQFEQPRGA